MGQFIDLTGQRFGRLVVHSVTQERGHSGSVKWLAICDCGNSTVVIGISLREGNTQSCGCLQRERSSAALSLVATTHGMTESPEYRSWCGAKERCYNPKNHKYPRYGARGIKVCDRWRDSFENFFADMGAKPSASHSIERKDNDGDYEPGNCIWALPQQQSRNTRRNRLVTLHGETRCLTEWIQVLGLNASTVNTRIYRRGIPPELALTR